jgi:hypothetical protein
MRALPSNGCLSGSTVLALSKYATVYYNDKLIVAVPIRSALGVGHKHEFILGMDIHPACVLNRFR